MKFLVLLAFVAVSCASHLPLQGVQQYTPMQGKYLSYYKEQYPEHLGQYQQQWGQWGQWGESYPHSYGQNYPQWFSEIPSTNYYYKYIQQYQELYQQGVWPIISQIYEQLTPSQYAALETLISRIGFPYVEVLFNYLAGNSFYFTPEQYQTLVSVIQQVGYPSIEQFLKVFAGEKFYLGYQHNYITFMPTFTLQYILRELQQYSVYPTSQYYGQYPQYYGSLNYKRQTPYSSLSFQKWLQPYYSPGKVPYSSLYYQGYQGYQPYQSYPYQHYQGYQGLQGYQSYQYPQLAY